MKIYRPTLPLKQAALLALFVFLFLFSYSQQEKVDTLSSLPVKLDSTSFPANVPIEEIQEDEMDNSSDTVRTTATVDEIKYFDEKSSASVESLTEKYHSRKVPDEVIQKAKNDPSFWYANTEIKTEKKKEPVKQSFIFSRLFQRILWIAAIAGFITFLVIYLASSNIKLFRRSGNIANEDASEPETDDIFNINYQREIDKALAMSNFRLATRLMFLRLLRSLSEKQIIEYTQDKTNMDYLIQLRSSHWYNDFFRVTRDYEYSWYGQFTLDKDKFNVIRKDFEGFENKLK